MTDEPDGSDAGSPGTAPTPTPTPTASDATDTVTALAAEWRSAGRPFARATVVRREPPVSTNVGDRALITPDGRLEGWVGGAACARDAVIEAGQRAVATGEPVLIGLAPDPATVDRPGLEAHRLTCHSGGSLEVFVEPVVSAPRLIVIGDSPIADSLTRLAAEFAIVADRVDPTTLDQGGSSGNEDLVAALGDPRFVVVATMGVADARGVAAAMVAGADYIGLISSERRAATVADRAADLLDDGPDAAAIAAAISAPAGVEIGAATPAEIALSVLTEVIAVRRGNADHAAGSTESVDEPDAPMSIAGDGGETAEDPVCGMTVRIREAPATRRHDDETFYFCCEGCAETFGDDPTAFAPDP